MQIPAQEVLGVGIAYAYTHPLTTPWGNTFQTCTFQMQNTYGATTKTQFASAISHWNAQLTKGFLYKSSSDTAETYPYQNGIKTVTKYSYGMNGIVAECVAFYHSAYGYVIETDIYTNSSYPFANSKMAGYYDVQSVPTHELGHALRVGHSTVSSDTMYTVLVNSDYARTVTAADRDAARASTARWFN
ncbi:MAG: matrixin family metalloprotease [Actinobacteria bacterium]|nr:matrixin family metalloprotease [Actinomycetota bacterium]